MNKKITNTDLYTSINFGQPYSENETLTVIIKDLEFELGKAAMKVFRGNQRIFTVINYIEVDKGHVMVSASFHGESH